MEPLGSDDPARIGEYRLLRRLGAGGMGRVYLGRTAGGRTVAVKVVRGELAEDPEFRARFRQEVAAARLVGGAWTAPVLDADTEGAHPWVATGYVAGPALGAAVRDFGPLPAAAVRAMGAGLAEALAHVHAQGLVHRDVKPSNVLLTLDGPRLIDFGIARALDAAAGLTQSGFVVGSPGYMSPEQARGAVAGPPSDVFSLGAVLAYAATGAAPFGDGVSAAVLLYRVLHEEPELGGLDAGLHAIVRDCLAKDPAVRPSPERLRELLAGVGGGTVRLRQAAWLPPAVAEAVGRSAVELLELDSEAPAGAAPAAGPVPVDALPTDHRPADTPPGVVPPAPAQPGAVPAGAVPGAAPTGDGTGTGPSADRPADGKARRTALLVALAVLAAPLLVYGGIKLRDATDGGTPLGDGTPTTTTRVTTGVTSFTTSWSTSWTSGPSPSAPAGSLPPPSSGGPSAGSPAPGGPSAVPASFLGGWEGEITTKIVPLPSTFRVEFVAGAVGQVVARTSNASHFSSTVCRGNGTLVSAEPRTLVIQEAPAENTPECTGQPERQTYTLAADGRLHLEVTGAAMGSDPSGDLSHKG
ncbi:serine/threonine protein kinase [Kitasatospora sp. NBC_00240]|uniref:serine/threonine-protein kinase n=1 Tax=Kitasatospora sp. NBC_00240 TaxID=2903567 RepID=UPI002258488B|nr:serine/threonine-protein kinase [Kitasatospora sp. NBC_00240]MCX5211230.1 serine/threonine protein kinase [Kitasatospora sp. NBC_00240]